MSRIRAEMLLISCALSLGVWRGTAITVQQPERKQEQRASVEGLVINAVTAMPVSGAHLMIRHPGPGFEARYDAKSDASGHFRLTHVRPGNYWLRVEKTGFLAQRTVSDDQTILTVRAGQNIRGMLVRAVPCSAITGQVLNEDGEAIAGIEVRAMVDVYDGRRRQWRVIRITLTDDLGRYRLYGLAPGAYYVAARYNAADESWGGIERTNSQADENYVDTFYPGTADAAAASAVSVAAGTEVGEIDMNLLKVPGKLVTSLTLSPETESEADIREKDLKATSLHDMTATGQNTAVIDGLIINRMSGRSVNKAHLILRRIGEGFDVPYVVESDEYGHFEMTNVEPGRYRLWEEQDGLPEQAYGADDPNVADRILSVRAGQHLHDILFRVTPPATINGKVLDENGEAVQGADVEAMHFVYQAGKRQLQIAAVVVTDDLGEFRLHGLPPGSYYVSASCHVAGGYGIATNRSDYTSGAKQYFRTFYPSTTQLAAAGSISVGSGAEVDGIEVWLRPTRVVRITGQVLAPGSPRVTGDTVVSLTSRDPNMLDASFTSTTAIDSHGNFELRDVTPGSYFISASVFYDHEQYVAGQELEVTNSDVRDLRMVLSKAVDLVGHLRIEGVSKQSAGNLAVELEPESDGKARLLAGHVRPDGSFTISTVPPFRYTLDVLGISGNLYLKSVAVMGEPLPDAVLDIHRIAGGPITVLLSGSGGIINGSVVDAMQLPASGAQVVLVPDRFRRNQMHLYKNTTTDSYGHFELTGIPPGEYELVARRNVTSDAYSDLDFLERLEESGEKVTVGESTNQNVVLRLQEPR